MASTSDIRNGFCFEFNHDVYTVIEFLHVKPGKGPAFVRTKLKSLTSGKIVDPTFPSGHKLEEVRVERRKFQYLYEDETGYNFMDNETYDQLNFPAKLIDNARFLKEGMEIEVLFNADNNTPLSLELPMSMVYEVTYTESAVAGNTSTNASKEATLETGAIVKVPLFINIGDKIKVNTTTGEYGERVKQ
jgi:elongation factor P